MYERVPSRRTTRTKEKGKWWETKKELLRVTGGFIHIRDHISGAGP